MLNWALGPSRPLIRTGTARQVVWYALLLSVGVLGPACNHRTTKPADVFTPKEGDLLFQDLDGGPLCDAIEQVTVGYDDTNLSHVGLVAADPNQGLVVIEAVSAGVVATPLPKFLARSLDDRHRPKVLVGRLNPAAVPASAALIRRAIAQARALEGCPYDKLFVPGNDSYYCSELIYEVFRRANDGRPVFPLASMTFSKPGTDKPLDAWATYFARRGAPIPEGVPGINPGGISRATVLTIIHEYGTVTRKSTGAERGKP